MRLDYALYMAETEGYLNTRESKLQRVIKEVRTYDAPSIPQEAFEIILMHNGIEPSSLTNNELSRIMRAIE